MSHIVNHTTYPVNVNKKEVQKSWDERAAREDYEEGCSGLCQDIRWIDHVCKNYNDAISYLEKEECGFYDQLAVKYLKIPNDKFVESKKLINLRERLKQAVSKYNNLMYKIHYKDIKSQFVGCKSCGSKLATKYIRSNYCPMCGADLRPESTLLTLKKYSENVEKLKREIEEERLYLEKKQAKKCKTYWLVKTEYHV